MSVLKTPSRPRASRGITLIEALIALFIMSIGLLGVAGLQATSIAAGHASGQRSLAVFLNAEIGERIRANRSAIAIYDTATTAPADNGCADTATLAANVCTDAQMAQEDLLEWQSALGVAFSGMTPVGTITVNQATTPATVTVSVTWIERGDNMAYTSILRI
ncbi:MAG: type IV pilus modification protein PilV [Pseudomonadota bacterium]